MDIINGVVKEEKILQKTTLSSPSHSSVSPPLSASVGEWFPKIVWPQASCELAYYRKCEIKRIGENLIVGKNFLRWKCDIKDLEKILYMWKNF